MRLNTDYYQTVPVYFHVIVFLLFWEVRNRLGLVLIVQNANRRSVAFIISSTQTGKVNVHFVIRYVRDYMYYSNSTIL